MSLSIAVRELKEFRSAETALRDQLLATARRGHLPDIIFDAAYGRRHVSDDGNLNTFPLLPTWQVQLTVNIPIFDGFRTTNRVQETLHNYNNVAAQEEDRKQQIALEVEQSYLRVVETQERIKCDRICGQSCQGKS